MTSCQCCHRASDMSSLFLSVASTCDMTILFLKAFLHDIKLVLRYILEFKNVHISHHNAPVLCNYVNISLCYHGSLRGRAPPDGSEGNNRVVRQASSLSLCPLIENKYIYLKKKNCILCIRSLYKTINMKIQPANEFKTDNNKILQSFCSFCINKNKFACK